MTDILIKLANMVEGVEDEREMLIRIIVSAAVLLVMLIFKNQLSKGISFVLCKLLFAKSKKAQEQVKTALFKPLSYFIAVSGAYIASEILLPSGEIRSVALVILKLCFIIIIAWFGINLINSGLSESFIDDSSGTRKTAMKFINNVLKGAIAVIAVLMILEQFGISASKLFAALGIGGVAVAFACKDTVENMLSGFIIIFDRPFEVEDFIEVNGDSGTVKDIKIRTTRLLGVDGCEKIYPNTAMANAAITNWSRMEKRAVKESISVDYSYSGDKLSQLCDDIRAVILNNESVIEEGMRVGFAEFGAHALEINIFFYVDKVKIDEYSQVKSEINADLKNYFDANKIKLAFESKSIYFADSLKIEK
ncbi:MAG: mechanosensitive ion channel family protein [Eubacterium sp.]